MYLVVLRQLLNWSMQVDFQSTWAYVVGKMIPTGG